MSMVALGWEEHTPAPDEVVEEVVRRLNELARAATVRLTLDMGCVIVGAFFGGDASAWRRRGPRDPSLRKLARHAGLGMSATSVYRAVAIYEMCDRLGPESRALNATQLRALLGLAPDDQRALLVRMQEGELTAEEIPRAAQEVRRRAGGGRGRPRLPRFVKSLTVVRRLLEDPDDAFGDLDEVRNIDEDHLDEMHRAVRRATRKLQEIERLLAARMRELDG